MPQEFLVERTEASATDVNSIEDSAGFAGEGSEYGDSTTDSQPTDWVEVVMEVSTQRKREELVVVKAFEVSRTVEASHSEEVSTNKRSNTAMHGGTHLCRIIDSRVPRISCGGAGSFGVALRFSGDGLSDGDMLVAPLTRGQ